MSTDYTGISFPIRLNSKGGMMLSSLNNNSVAHIEEAMLQILLTYKMERTMETHFHSDIDSFVFSTIDETEETLLKHFILEALKLEPRVTVSREDIKVVDAGENTLKVNISYRLEEFGTSNVFEVDLKGGTYETT